MPLPTVLFGDLFTVARAGLATVVASNGALTDVAAGAPRFNFASTGTPVGLLIEGVDINYDTNPLWLGTVAGTPPTGSPPTGGTLGTSPTGSSIASPTAINGLSLQIVGVQTIAGEAYLVLRYYGTANSSTQISQQLVGSITSLAASPLDFAVNFLLLGGSVAGLSRVGIGANVSGASIPATNVVSQLGSTPVAARMTKAAGVGTDGTATYFLQVTPVSGAQIDITFGVGLKRILRTLRTAGSLIRPAAGGSGPTTRNRDDVRWKRVDWWDVARMSGSTNVGSTVMFEFAVQQVSQAAEQGLLRIDDGTSSNRMEFYVAANSSQVACRRVIGGTAAVTTLGSIAASVPFRLAFAGNNSSIISVVSGGDLTSIPLGGGTFTPARCLLGSITTDDTTPLWGVCSAALAYPLRQPNLTLLQLVDTSISIATLRAEGGA